MNEGENTLNFIHLKEINNQKKEESFETMHTKPQSPKDNLLHAIKIKSTEMIYHMLFSSSRFL